MNTQFKTQVPPAQLLVGPLKTIINHAKQLLKTRFCAKGGCQTCITCQQIEQEQHHSTLWLTPDKQYTLDQLDPIFSTIAFALEPHQQFFFVIQKADFLTPACSNSLLKSVEEPPPGYHFLFLTERSQQILPTIRSRCITHSFYTGSQHDRQELVDIFKDPKLCEPSIFLKILSHKNPNSRETVEYIDILFAHWLKKAKTNEHNSTAWHAVTHLKQALINPPMPGSNKIFWKNFYLQMKNL